MSMYLAHFGLTEAPFKITPHTEFFFDGANRGETLDALIYAVMSGEGMVKVTGEVGSGKTMLCRVLMERLPKEVETIYLAVPSISRDEILATIAGDLGIDTHGLTTTKIIRALQQRLIDLHAANKQVVALIDEAHAMPLATLEEIRLLSNLETNRDKLMQIVLFGQPELDAHLALPNMRQLRERITHSFDLQPLPARAIGEYLNFRLRQAGYKGPDLFRGDTVKVIAEASEGLTRRINIFADKTLLAAYAAGTHDVTAKHARAAVADSQIVMPSASPATAKWPIAAALAAGLLLGGLVGYQLGSTQGATQPIGGKENSAGVVQSAPAAEQRVSPPSAPAETASKPISSPAVSPTPLPGVEATAKAASPEETIKVKAAPEPASPQKPTESVIENRPLRAGAEWLDARMQADIGRLNASGAVGFAIQLMTADQREEKAIRDFLRAASRELESERIIVLPSGTTENPKVSVVYGPFDERGVATSEMARLSPRMRQFRPYLRSAAAVRADLRPQT